MCVVAPPSPLVHLYPRRCPESTGPTSEVAERWLPSEVVELVQVPEVPVLSAGAWHTISVEAGRPANVKLALSAATPGIMLG